eukprot:3467047-Pyramimonas_sp.AAC.1
MQQDHLARMPLPERYGQTAPATEFMTASCRGLPEPRSPCGHDKFLTGGVALCSASGGPRQAPGPSRDDSGCKAGSGEWVETSGVD